MGTKKEIFISNAEKKSAAFIKEFYNFMLKRTDNFENIAHDSLVIKGPFLNSEENNCLYIVEYKTHN